MAFPSVERSRSNAPKLGAERREECSEDVLQKRWLRLNSFISVISYKLYYYYYSTLIIVIFILLFITIIVIIIFILSTFRFV